MSLRTLALLSLLAALSLGTALQAADLGGVTLKVGSDTTSPPMESVDPASGQIVGFDKANRSLDICNQGEPLSLDPHKATGSWENNIIGNMFVGLTTEDPKGEPIPGMAERWETSEDGLTWTFHLRADAHDPALVEALAQRRFRPLMFGDIGDHRQIMRFPIEFYNLR